MSVNATRAKIALGACWPQRKGMPAQCRPCFSAHWLDGIGGCGGFLCVARVARVHPEMHYHRQATLIWSGEASGSCRMSHIGPIRASITGRKIACATAKTRANDTAVRSTRKPATLRVNLASLRTLSTRTHLHLNAMAQSDAMTGMLPKCDIALQPRAHPTTGHQRSRFQRNC
jgi:hypothetical protein